MKRMRSFIAAPVVMAALLTAGAAGTAVASPAFAPPAVAAPARAALPCHASMSNNRPRDYTTTYVRVHTTGYASVTTVAHYRTTNHKKTGKAGRGGNASIGYYISGATPGYKVVVSVRVVHGDRSGNCSTSFIPHR
ncbi:MAG: hypothetical protein ABSA02_33695 [Trebonia sp.]|jgi:hypothetical protein